MSSDENGLGPSSPSDPEGIEAAGSTGESEPPKGSKAGRWRRPVDGGGPQDWDRATDAGRGSDGRPTDAARLPAGPIKRARASIPDDRLEAVLARIGAGFYDDPETITQVAIRILALERYRLFED